MYQPKTVGGNYNQSTPNKQKYKATKIQKYKSTKIQNTKYKNTNIQEYKNINCKIQKYKEVVSPSTLLGICVVFFVFLRHDIQQLTMQVALERKGLRQNEARPVN